VLLCVGVTEGHAVSKITVKGAPASSEQKRILRRALQLADRWGAPYKAKVALVEALIVESEAKNLSSSSADGYGSYGVLQGRDIYHSRSDLMDSFCTVLVVVQDDASKANKSIRTAPAIRDKSSLYVLSLALILLKYL